MHALQAINQELELVMVVVAPGHAQCCALRMIGKRVSQRKVQQPDELEPRRRQIARVLLPRPKGEGGGRLGSGSGSGLGLGLGLGFGRRLRRTAAGMCENTATGLSIERCRSAVLGVSDANVLRPAACMAKRAACGT